MFGEKLRDRRSKIDDPQFTITSISPAEAGANPATSAEAGANPAMSVESGANPAMSVESGSKGKEPGLDCNKDSSGVVRGPWSPEEDSMLRRLVEKYGARNWSLISKGIPGRSGKSCRLRWCNLLSPQVEYRPLSPKKDATIDTFPFGSTDNAIINHCDYPLPRPSLDLFSFGSTDNAIKNHWDYPFRRPSLDLFSFGSTNNAIKNRWDYPFRRPSLEMDDTKLSNTDASSLSSKVSSSELQEIKKRFRFSKEDSEGVSCLLSESNNTVRFHEEDSEGVSGVLSEINDTGHSKARERARLKVMAMARLRARARARVTARARARARARAKRERICNSTKSSLEVQSRNNRQQQPQLHELTAVTFLPRDVEPQESGMLLEAVQPGVNPTKRPMVMDAEPQDSSMLLKAVKQGLALAKQGMVRDVESQESDMLLMQMLMACVQGNNLAFACEMVKEICASNQGSAMGKVATSFTEEPQQSGLPGLVHMLMAFAEAIQENRLAIAGKMVREITILASNQSGTVGKVATYVAKALACRIHGLMDHFTDFNLSGLELKFCRLRWLVHLALSGSHLLDHLLSESGLRLDASGSTSHRLDVLSQHIQNLPSLQVVNVQNTLRLPLMYLHSGEARVSRQAMLELSEGQSTLHQIPSLPPALHEANGQSTFHESCNIDRTTISEVKVVDQISNKRRANSSAVYQISNVKRARSSVVEPMEMEVSIDSSHEVLNFQNTFLIPQQIGDLLAAKVQNLQSTFTIPLEFGDLSKSKVINLQNLICLSQQMEDVPALKVIKLRSSLCLPQHNRDLSALKVLNLQNTLLDKSASSLGKLGNLSTIIRNKCDNSLELPEGPATLVGKNPLSKEVPVHNGKYCVFLIYHGPDVSKTMIGNLVKSLSAGGLKALDIDLDEWEMASRKCLSLKQASEATNIHIPILSKHYANSFCHLEQLLCMCRSNSLVRPLFYDVEPSDVLNKDIKGLYEKALDKLVTIEDFSSTIATAEVCSSGNALPQVSFLSGWSLSGSRDMQNLVKRVVFDILQMLNNLPLHAVGLEKRMEDMTDKLEMESDSVIIVAICGMGGIGKTTLAKAIFHSIGSRFQACSFVAVKAKEVRKLQQEILKDLSRQDIPVKSIEHGKALMKAHLGSVRALVILDDIDNPSQLEALNADWLAPGSRLLLTSRDPELLSIACTDKIYHMDLLEFEHSIELFSWHAFLRKHPDDRYEDRSQKIVEACHGIPLLLEVVGASLYGREDIIYWDYYIRHLESTIDQDIHRRLCVSVWFLGNHETKIFLDIACFFVGKENLETASRYWEAIGFAPNTAIEKLILKSLISVNDKNHFIVHEHLQDMGRAMVADESLDLGERSRLWRPEDALQVLSKYLGTEGIRGISISGAERSDIILQAESFAPMTNLQLLWIEGKVVEGDFQMLSPNLRWLRWNACPLRFLPSEWCIEHLAILDLSSVIGGSSSELRELWSERSLCKEFKNLNVLRVSSAQYLKSLPDFSYFPALSVLDLEDCPNLTRLPDSIGILEGLKCLNLSWCKNLIELPHGISKLTSLERLLLRHCFLLKELPCAVEELMALKELDIGFSRRIEKLPSFVKLFKLEKLILAGCLSIRFLPNTIGELDNLKELDIQFLGLIQELPSLAKLSCLKKLILSGCGSLRNLPVSIGELRCLQYLEMNECSSIDCLPEEFGDLFHLEELFMNHCPRLIRLPSSFGNLVNLRTLELRHNPNLMQLPSSFSKLASLVWFDASDCNLLDGLHEGMGDLLALGILNLENNFFCQLPTSVHNLTNLTKLNLNNCQSLEELPTLPQGVVELDVGNCTQLITLPGMSHLKRLTSLILCNCESLLGLPQLNSCQPLVVLNISRCINIRSLAGVEGLRSLKTLYFGGSGVSILDLGQQIEDMPQLEEACIYANRIPQWLELKSGDHYLNDDNFKDLLFYSVEINTKCRGVFLCFVLNFMHDCHTSTSLPQNSMEMTIGVDDQEAILVTIFSNRQNVEGDQLFICMYGETHSLVRRLETAVSISLRAKGRNIQIRECGMQLLYNGIGNGIFERLVNDLSLLVENYTLKASKDKDDAIEDDSPHKTKDEEDVEDDLFDYGYASSEGEYQTDEY